MAEVRTRNQSKGSEINAPQTAEEIKKSKKRVKHKMKKSTADKVADVLIYAVITIFALMCIIPFIHVLSVSISSDADVYANNVFLIPKHINFNAYKTVIGDKSMMQSLGFTVVMTLVFTLLGMFVTICAAYALSKPQLKGRYFFSTMFLITMYFSAGTIPDYLLIDSLNLLDTAACLILPLVFSAYNMIILRTFMENSIPDSLLEAAKLDGCDEFRTLVSVVLPLSKPVLATLALFYAVGRWNSFQDALYYIQSDSLKPLQLKLYNLVNASGSTGSLAQEAGGGQQQAQEVVKSATIMFATLPIVVVYPFVQKYFVSGVMIGAVKG